MTRPNAFQSWLNQKEPDKKTELKNLTLVAQTSKVAYQAMKKRGFRGSYDSILNFRNANKQDSSEAIAASVAVFEQKLTETTQSASNPLEGALLLSVEMNSLCSKLVGLLAAYEWTDGGEPLNIRDALKLAAVIPSLARASTGSLIELFNLRNELDRESFADALYTEVLIEAEITYKEDLQYIPIVANVLKSAKIRLEMGKERCLESNLMQ